MKILIVDDDSSVRRLLATLLTHVGHEVVEVADGPSGWELWQRGHTRMIITDWMMPDMDGPELIRRIRAAASPGYTYVILLTAKVAKSDVVTGLEAGADDYLIKPFDAGELRARVAIGERILSLEMRLQESVARLAELATIDDLTGLFNRRHFFDLAGHEFDRSRRYHRPLCGLMLDLDHFKQVNDTWGHAVGDEVLKAIADRCRNGLREMDLLGRYGGEEFAVLLPETDLPTAGQVAERLRESVAGAPVATARGPLAVTISLGLAASGADTPDLNSLFERTDVALYAAKQAGRNRVAGLTGQPGKSRNQEK